MIVQMSARQNSLVASTVSPTSILNLCYFRHQRSLLNKISAISIVPYFSTTSSRIQKVHLFCNDWAFIFLPFLPFTHQYCSVERLPFSRWYPQQKIIDKNKISSEERIDEKRRLSCPLQERRPGTWGKIEPMLWYLSRSRLQAIGPRRGVGMPRRPCKIFLKKKWHYDKYKRLGPDPVGEEGRPPSTLPWAGNCLGTVHRWRRSIWDRSDRAKVVQTDTSYSSNGLERGQETLLFFCFWGDRTAIGYYYTGIW